MKKLLFTALVAIVAVGGAFAQYRTTPGAGSAEINCTGSSTPFCSSLGVPIYNLDGSPADEEVYNLHYTPAAF